jgi:hypothetical protein
MHSSGEAVLGLKYHFAHLPSVYNFGNWTGINEFGCPIRSRFEKDCFEKSTFFSESKQNLNPETYSEKQSPSRPFKYE